MLGGCGCVVYGEEWCSVSSRKKHRGVISGAAPKSPNDFSDLEGKFTRYNSKLIDRLKREGLYDSFLETIASMSFTQAASIAGVVSGLRERFPDHLGSLSEYTFSKWIKYYPDVSEAFNFKKQFALGQLAYMAMKRARYTMYADRQEDFILKLMDRLNDGTLSPKGAVGAVERFQNSSGMSSSTMMTLSRVFAEASRFGGLGEVNIDDMEDDESAEYFEGLDD